MSASSHTLSAADHARQLSSRHLYQLIVSQLLNDGFNGAAAAVAEATMTPCRPDIPRNRLYNIVQATLQGSVFTEDKGDDDVVMANGEAPVVDLGGVDLDVEPRTKAKAYPSFTTRFITTHKSSCRVAKFSIDGKYVMTASSDMSMKMLDVSKMLSHNVSKSEPGEEHSSRPVIRTFYDHTAPINDLDFHPKVTIVASCSKDCSIKFFDYSKASAKRGFRALTDLHNVRSIHFHPSGDYLLSATDNPIIRLYDANTLQCYASSQQHLNHFSAINQVRWSIDGGLFASAGKDGSIKVWDGVSNRCVTTFPNAHAGAEVCSIQFSLNSKYLLSGGKDSTARLWDLATGRQLLCYVGAHQQTHRMQTIFGHNEDTVLGADETTLAVHGWDTRTGEPCMRLSGHLNIVRWLSVSPVDSYFMSCGDDHRARFWVPDRGGDRRD